MKEEDYKILSEEDGIITYHCNVCEVERPYTKGIFTKKSTTARWSCGCSKKKGWNETQFKTRLLYQLPDNYKFLGYRGKFKGAMTKLVIYCTEHDTLCLNTTFNYWNTYFGKSAKIPCKLCENNYIYGRNILRRRLQLMEDIPQYNNLLKGSIEVVKGGKDVKFKTHCCGDNYTPITSLKRKYSCKCLFTKDKESRESLIEMHLLLENSGHFKGWASGFNGDKSRDRFKWVCNGCGKENLTVFLDFKQGIRCRHCCVSGFKRDEKASLYLLSIGSDIIKVGISNKPKNRIQNIKKGTDLKVSLLVEVVFDKGLIAESAEEIIKQRFNYGDAFKNIIADGWTESCKKEDFDEVHFWETVGLYKEHILKIQKPNEKIN